MKLIPKAKPIKIRISSGGKEHSTLQSLLEYFRIADVRPLMENGVMLKWLSQIGENILCDKIRSVSEVLTDAKKWSDSDVISVFFNSPDKLVEYAECTLRNSEPNALEYLQSAAETGNPSALYRLGCVYYFSHNIGVVIVTDIAKAEEYLKQAAESDHPLAKMLYGFILCEKEHYSDAFELIDKNLYELADKDYKMQDDRLVIAMSYYALGNIYLDGKDEKAPQSSHKAIELFRESAERGYKRACTALGKIYMKSKRTYCDALKYLEKALELKDVEGIYHLGHLYKELGKPENESARMFRRAAVCGWGEGMVEYGEHLYSVKKYYVEAVKWFERAYEKGVAGAAYNLGLCYVEGNGKPKDYDKALEYFRKEMENEGSYYKEAASEKCKSLRNVKTESNDRNVMEFTKQIERWTVISKTDLIGLATTYHISLSMAKSIAQKHNVSVK